MTRGAAWGLTTKFSRDAKRHRLQRVTLDKQPERYAHLAPNQAHQEIMRL